MDQYNPGYEGDEAIYPCYGEWEHFLTPDEHNHVKALYAAEVTMVDRWLGYLLETVGLLGLKEDTMVVLMSDHGHYFGDHGLQGKPWGDYGQLYEPMIRQPFIVRQPDGGRSGQRTSALVQPIDLFPTVVQMAELDAPDGLQGRSFVDVLRGQTETHREVAISGRNLDDHWGTVPATVTDNRWSLIYWPNKDLAFKGKPPLQETYPNTGMPERRVDELFDLQTDPDQERNVIADHPKEARRLHARLLDLIEESDVDPAIARTYEPLPG